MREDDDRLVQSFIKIVVKRLVSVKMLAAGRAQ
jgi:hypothetical protein